MNTQERLNSQARAQEWTLERQHSNQVRLVILVTLGSLMAGLIPFAYASTFGSTQSQTSTNITTSEAGVWSVLAEKLGHH